MEHEPRHQRRCHAFERQQKRGGRRVGTLQSSHEQNGASDAARHDRASKVGHVTAAQGRLGASSLDAGRPAYPTHDGDTDARSAIEEACQNGRMGGPEQHLGRWRGDAEQGGRQQGQDDGRAVHGGRLDLNLGRRQQQRPEGRREIHWALSDGANGMALRTEPLGNGLATLNERRLRA